LDEYLLIINEKGRRLLDDFDLKKEQLKDKHLVPVFTCLESGDPNRLYKNFEIINSVLCQKANETFKSRPIIPRHLRETILKWHHNCNLAAHIGRERNFEFIAKRYFWPGMYIDIQRWVAACLKCIQHKRLKPKHHGLLVPIQSTYPFEIVSIDIIGPFKTTVQGYKYVLVIVDMFTSWVDAVPVLSPQSSTNNNLIGIRY